MAGADETVEIRGLAVPRIGFGTWQITGPDCEQAVRDALELGYRHVDTARVYENEREVGRALASGGVPREEVWLTTKVWMDDATAGRARASVEGSLRDLGTDYVDLLLLHWPNPDVPIAETLDAFAALRDEGKVRAFGVSNFPPRLLREALEPGELACDQVEYHVRLGQPELLAIAERHDLLIAAYAPFAHGAIFDEPVLAEIGAAHGKSPAQVALRWLIEQPRVCALPKAASHRNRAANIDVFDFELGDEERARIDALPKDGREFDPPWAPEWD